MKTKVSVLLIIYILLICAGCLFEGENQTGSEIENEFGYLYMENGDPASGASVQFVESKYNFHQTAGGWIDDFPVVIANKNGRFPAPENLLGTYNILAKRGGYISFQDSVIFTEAPDQIPPDTLKTAGSITGCVEVQPFHNPRIATISVMGTQKYLNVNESGCFTISQLAEGNYDLSINIDEENYITTYKSISITAGKADTLQSPIQAIYVGIPIVRNIQAAYDSAHQVVRLTWEAKPIRNFDKYLIFRSGVNNDISISNDRLIKTENYQLAGITVDTNWVDSLSGIPPTALPPYQGSARLRYKVRVLDLLSDTSVNFGYKELTLPGQAFYKHQKPEIYYQSEPVIFRNEPCSLQVSLRYGQTQNVRWGWKMGPETDTSFTNKPVLSVSVDTLTPAFPIEIFALSQDSILARLIDTLSVQLRWHKIGEPFVSGAMSFASFIFHDALYAITSDYANSSLKNRLWHMESHNDWKLISDSIPVPPRIIKQMYVTDSLVWIIGGKTLTVIPPYKSTFPKDFWKTNDLLAWEPLGMHAELDSLVNIVPYTYNGELYYFGYAFSEEYIKDHFPLWKLQPDLSPALIPHKKITDIAYQYERYPRQWKENIILRSQPMTGFIDVIWGNDWSLNWPQTSRLQLDPEIQRKNFTIPKVIPYNSVFLVALQNWETEKMSGTMLYSIDGLTLKKVNNNYPGAGNKCYQQTEIVYRDTLFSIGNNGIWHVR